MNDRPTWPERIYTHNRQKLWWAVPLLVVLVIINLWTLVRAAIHHVIYGRIIGGRDYILLAENPIGFWRTVAIHTGALVAVVLILTWMFLGYRALRGRTIRSRDRDPE